MYVIVQTRGLMNVTFTMYLELKLVCRKVE